MTWRGSGRVVEATRCGTALDSSASMAADDAADRAWRSTSSETASASAGTTIRSSDTTTRPRSSSGARLRISWSGRCCTSCATPVTV